MLERYFLMSLLCAFSSRAAKIVCRVLSVKDGEGTTLCCYFPEDVSQSKKDFTVYHYSTMGRPGAVVDCLWPSGRLECFTHSGYEFDKAVTNSMAVHIPRVTSNETGKYACQITGAMSDDLGFCDLHLRPDSTSCELRSVDAATEIALTCFFSEDVSQLKKEFAVFYIHENGSSSVVIDCFWYLDNISCVAQSGYYPQPGVSSRFTVWISRTSMRQNGSYMCEISGTGTHHASLCSLPVPGKESAQHDCRHEMSVVAIVASLFGLSLAIVITVLMYFVIRKRLLNVSLRMWLLVSSTFTFAPSPVAYGSLQSLLPQKKLGTFTGFDLILLPAS